MFVILQGLYKEAKQQAHEILKISPYIQQTRLQTHLCCLRSWCNFPSKV